MLDGIKMDIRKWIVSKHTVEYAEPSTSATSTDQDDTGRPVKGCESAANVSRPPGDLGKECPAQPLLNQFPKRL